MLFLETLKKYGPQVEDAVDELFSTIEAKQTHEQDLLLIEINGFYQANLESPLHGGEKVSPYVFGIGGWSYYTDHTQYRFFDAYRREIEETPRNEYFADFKTNLKKQAHYDMTLQLELMAYLKFWESDVMLRKLYQLSNLAQGKNYDWHYTLGKDDSRQNLIRNIIRDPIKKICPKFYQLIKDIYLSQIRNATAHSQFYIEQGKLGFTNYDPADHAPLSQISFDEWEERFHKLALMYNELIRNFNKYRERYIKEENEKHYGLQIRITKKDKSVRHEFIKYVDIGSRADWMWYRNWAKYYSEP
ncbi:hypothetical protein [Dawidia soli]|uniref:Uncharacterized protein n=1 Tax=Dawidia soli TaxID=2782352 RepID=A0AAP2DGC7_9BACT|nr:hypothetical protein [Dawidia soli]MBT1688857.1 hypothetical protein [Dawidia soli]